LKEKEITYMNILVIEDDRRISEFLVKGLEENEFLVTLCESGNEARNAIIANEWDLIIADIMLPDMDGIQLIKMIRYKKISTPILALSALSETDDKVRGLDSGADDYLTKPFHFKELLARINALTRRSKIDFSENIRQLSCFDITIDLDQHIVTRSGKEIELSPREFKLLQYLMENKNKVLSRTKILNSVWGIDYNTNTNIVDVYVSYLRLKIDEPFAEKMIHTVKGVGYILKEPV
jgi:two-component system, OmpR family, response regulator